MLTLTRGAGRSIMIGEQIIVKVLEVKGERIRLGIEAPKELTIVRAEDVEPPDKSLPSTRRPD